MGTSKIKRVKHFSMEKKDARAGFLFITPWLFGFLFLFGRSLIDSIRYSVSDLKLGAFGMRLDFVGMDHYVAAFKSDPFFVENLLKALSRMAYEVPIILFFSLFIAILLNQKFRGRTISRALFFLPVIVASGVVINALKQKAGMNIGVDLAGDVVSRAVDTTFIFQADRLSEVLLQTGLSPRIVEFFTGIVNRVFDLSWKSGIQILIYLTGLHLFISNLSVIPKAASAPGGIPKYRGSSIASLRRLNMLNSRTSRKRRTIRSENSNPLSTRETTSIRR